MQELAHLEPEVCPKLETKPHHGSWKKQRRVKGKFAKGMAGRSGNLSGLSKKEQAWRVRRREIVVKLMPFQGLNGPKEVTLIALEAKIDYQEALDTMKWMAAKLKTKDRDVQCYDMGGRWYYCDWSNMLENS